jgi:hypothetical protein
MTMMKNLGMALLCATGSTNAFLRSTTTTPLVTSSSSFALYSKNSDRARMERLLEESMGDDWKLFRAKLVAQEKAEAAATAKQSALSSSSEATSSLTTTTTTTTSSSSDHHPELSRNGQLGDLFGSAISSIFNSKKNQETTNRPQQQQQQLANTGAAADIFDGQSVGGANTNWIHPTEDANKYYDLSSFYHQDPFCSTAELPIHIQPKKNSIVNKHRWAHEIDHIESGSVLIANEKLGGVFHQTVVLIVDHHKETGTTGIVINRYVILCCCCCCCCCCCWYSLLHSVAVGYIVVGVGAVWIETVRLAGPHVTHTHIRPNCPPPPLSFSCNLHYVLFLSCSTLACLLSFLPVHSQMTRVPYCPTLCTTHTHTHNYYTDLCKVIYSRLPRKFLKKQPIWICP